MPARLSQSSRSAADRFGRRNAPRLAAPTAAAARPAGGLARPAGASSIRAASRTGSGASWGARSAQCPRLAPRRGAALFPGGREGLRRSTGARSAGPAVIASSESSIRRPPISCARSACSRAGRSGSCHVPVVLPLADPLPDHLVDLRDRHPATRTPPTSCRRCPVFVAKSCAACISSRAVRSGSSCCRAWARTASHGASCRSLGRSGIRSGTARAPAMSPCAAQLGGLLDGASAVKASRSARLGCAGSGGPVTTWMVFFSRPRVAPV